MGKDNIQLPISKVVYVVGDPTPECLESVKAQSYKNIGLVYKENIHPPLLFNQVISDLHDVLLFGFISGDTVLDKEATQKVVDKNTQYKDQSIGGLYGDSTSDYYHSYSKTLLKKNVFNPNIYINGRIKTPLFDPELQYLYFYDALLKISSNTMIYHIPEILYKRSIEHCNVSEDLKKLGINVNS